MQTATGYSSTVFSIQSIQPPKITRYCRARSLPRSLLRSLMGGLMRRLTKSPNKEPRIQDPSVETRASGPGSSCRPVLPESPKGEIVLIHDLLVGLPELNELLY